MQYKKQEKVRVVFRVNIILSFFSYIQVWRVKYPFVGLSVRPSVTKS